VLSFQCQLTTEKRGCFYPLIIVITNDVTLFVVVIEEKEGWGTFLPIVFVIIVVVARWQQQ
jgi:hypothetical protein